MHRECGPLGFNLLSPLTNHFPLVLYLLVQGER